MNHDTTAEQVPRPGNAVQTELPRISICILCHNYGRYLRTAIGSCLSQDPGDYQLEEVIVINDGSTDDSLTVAESYGTKVRIITTPHSGFGATLSCAISSSRGDWVALLDADDWFASSKLKSTCRWMNDGRLLIQHFERVVDEDGMPLTPHAHRGGNTSTILVERVAALDLLPVSNELFFHVLGDLGSSVQLDEPLTYYRVHPGAMTDRVNPGVREDYMVGVCRDLAAHLASIAAQPPAWVRQPALKPLRHHYLAEMAAHQVEGAVQRGHRLHAARALPSQFVHAVLSRRSIAWRWPSLRSVITGRPCIRLAQPAAGGPAQAAG